MRDDQQEKRMNGLMQEVMGHLELLCGGAVIGLDAVLLKEKNERNWEVWGEGR
jgi:hypothetical protein